MLLILILLSTGTSLFGGLYLKKRYLSQKALPPVNKADINKYISDLNKVKDLVKKDETLFTSKEYKTFKDLVDLINQLKDIHFKGIFNVRLSDLINSTINLYEANLKSIQLLEDAEKKKIKVEKEKEILYSQNKKLKKQLKGLIKELIDMENKDEDFELILKEFESSLKNIQILKSSRVKKEDALALPKKEEKIPSLSELSKKQKQLFEKTEDDIKHVIKKKQKEIEGKQESLKRCKSKAEPDKKQYSVDFNY